MMVFTTTKYLLLMACLDFSLAPVSAEQLQLDTFEHSGKAISVRIFRKNDTTFSVTLSGQGAETEYVAVGLSTDLKMGGDAVIACTKSSVDSYINPGGYKSSEKTNWITGTLEKSEFKKEGDNVSCSFDLPSIITATKDISFDLNKMDPEQYVLLARGAVKDDGTLQQHEEKTSAKFVLSKTGQTIKIPIPNGTVNEDTNTTEKSKVATPEPAGKFCLTLLTIAGWYFYTL